MTDERNRCRQEFLRERYGVLWSNVDRSMRSIWNVLGIVTVAGTILAAVHKGYLPFTLGASLALLVPLWALNITIDLNAWHRRNMFFITAIEREFLEESDFGTLLPRSYKMPQSGWITYYRINMIAFLGMLVMVGVYVGCSLTNESKTCVHWLILGAGALVTVINYILQERSAKKHFREMFQEHGDLQKSEDLPN